jgi:hypothetical protein
MIGIIGLACGLGYGGLCLRDVFNYQSTFGMSMMELVRRLEAVGEALFLHKMPFQLQASVRKGLADALWIIAGVVGCLQLLSAVLLWRAGLRANELADTANYLSRLYGNDTVVGHVGLFFYVTLALALYNVVLILMAVPGLRHHRKAKGWDYLLYALLLSLLIGLLRVFSDVHGGIGNLLLALVSAGVGGYVLFQVRSYFNGTGNATSDSAANGPESTKRPKE